jgi:ribonuclease P protein component
MLPVSAIPVHDSAPPSGDGKGAGFPRSARLLRRADFDRVYKQGRRHFAAHMTVFYLRVPRPGGLRVGFTVGRMLGGAVDRNRMKRRLREAVRLEGVARLLAADVVINPKKSVLTADFRELRNEINRAFQVIAKKSEGTHVRKISSE